VLCCPAVPLAPPLPSTASAPGRPGLFGRFHGTMGGSDFPGLCISGFRLLPCRRGLAIECQADQGPPGFRADGFRTRMGSRTAQGQRAPRHGGASRVAFRSSLQRHHSGVSTFRGSIPSLPVPFNGSPAPSRVTTHDSGSSWAATPSTYGSFIHQRLPASRCPEMVGARLRPLLQWPPPHLSLQADRPRRTPGYLGVFRVGLGVACRPEPRFRSPEGLFSPKLGGRWIYTQGFNALK